MNVNQIRSLLDRALECSTYVLGKDLTRRMRNSPTLWLLALSFEVEQSNAARLKSLFFRGIRACPWSKEMYMRCFQSMQGVLGEEEMQELFVLMGDKEVRVRVG